ncbi:hypothetical protein V5799_020694 [Amblyomma americanum]|uniref:Lipase domain-containing protein n=1 Tax=Amblyomma americanum TaxID=6943 RepID=A0AAQ4ET89_AMBAM
MLANRRCSPFFISQERRAGAEKVCYANVGCFLRRDRLTLPSQFPGNPNLFPPRFLLYCRSQGHYPTIVQLKPKENYRYLRLFKKTKPLYILIHGWLESAYTPWAQAIKDALLQEADCNVMVVDWSGLAATTYAGAAANTAAVGRTLSLLVQRLFREFPLRAALVHAIGYSFGAQVAGFFGRNLRRDTGSRIARITALDPAGPLFNDTNVCVCSEDAAFVDVIHTSGGYLHQPWQLGLLRPTGHVDFYVNGAKNQPGCYGSSLCDHQRAPNLFLESLVNKACRLESQPCTGGYAAFLRHQCGRSPAAGGSSGEMGFFCPRAAGRGVQLVTTAAGPLRHFCIKKRKA